MLANPVGTWNHKQIGVLLWVPAKSLTSCFIKKYLYVETVHVSSVGDGRCKWCHIHIVEK